MKKIILYIGVLLLTVIACTPARRARKAELKPRSEKYLMKHLLRNQVNAKWLGSKVRVTYRDEYMNERFTAYIRMKKDSAIWMSFKKFSLEGARALITPDSIFVIDRLNGQYLAKPFSYIREEFHLPVGFEGLQAMLLGNPVFFSSQTKSSVDSTHYLLLQKTDNLTARYWVDGGRFLLRRFHIDDFRNHREMTYTASEYKALSGKQNFSYFRRFNVKSPGLGQIEVGVDFSKVEIDVPQKMSFSIPDRYEKVD